MSDRPAGTALSTRFLVYYALAYILLIGLMGFFVERSAREALAEEVEHRLESTARLAADSRPDDEEDLQEWASSIFRATGFRVTLVGPEGTVLADSHSDPALMENHADRPEVLAARAGDLGVSRRISVSTGFEQLYVAPPTEDGLVTRVSVATQVIDEELGAVRTSILTIALIVGLAGVGVVALLARRMADPITELTEQSRAVAEGTLDVTPRRSRVRELDQLGLAISGLARDLGERLTQSEQASETLEVVLGALPQGTILIDGSEEVIYANPSAYELLGAVPDQLQGLVPFQFQAAVRAARSTREPESRVVDHGKPGRRLRAVATPFADYDWVLLIVADITARERTDAIRRDFVANASHELKTPVSTIAAASEALQLSLERGDESAPVFARQIERSARQLDMLVADLLDLSRLERESPEMSQVRLDLLASDEVERAGPKADEKGITLGLATEEVTVHANHRDIAIAARNLLDNAVRYTPEGGTISVTVSADNGHAVMSVSDTGEGIPRRELDRVFERFYRVDSARSRTTGGTGLGLAIVKHVAESHGGSVAVESQLGSGSTFKVRLPLPESGEGAGTG